MFFHISKSYTAAPPARPHSANFDEKVHKPQSKSYGRIGANMQFYFTHIS